MEDIIIGSHVSYNKQDQLVGSVKEALSYGANTFMFYTGAPQNALRFPIDPEKTKEAFKLMKGKIRLEDVIIHAPYIINLANDTKNYDFSVQFLKEELRRAHTLGIQKVVLHPGSHVGLGEEKGIQNIIFALNEIFLDDLPVMVLLETMAGKGSECGKTLEELKQIIDGVNNKQRIGICLDTCHLSDAGYDIKNFDQFLQQFDKIIGLERVKCIHINDSKNELGAKKDRHENLGFGKIGFSSLLSVLYHEKLKGIPKILETPYVKLDTDSKISFPPYRFEIVMIRDKKWNPNLLEDIRNAYK